MAKMDLPYAGNVSSRGIRAPQLHILHVTTGLNDGGAEAVLSRLCTARTEERHKVISLTDLGKYGADLQNADVEVVSLNMPRGQFVMSAFVRLIRIMRTDQPDVVQTWMYHGSLIGGIAAKIARRRCVVWGIHHSVLDSVRDKRATIWVAKAMGLLSGLVPTKIIMCSSASVAAHVPLGYRKTKVEVVANGYDLKSFRPDADMRKDGRSRLHVPRDMPLLGMVARFDLVKDHTNLIHALSILRERNTRWCCVLVGAGVDQQCEQLTRMVREANLQQAVLLCGQQAQVAEVMNAIDVHVLSSQSEAFPNVVAEAMACGTPCVATNVGDTAKIIGDTGWLVPPKDPSALASGIQQALDEVGKPSWKVRQLAARRRIEGKFSIETMVERYRRVWREALSSLN